MMRQSLILLAAIALALNPLRAVSQDIKWTSNYTAALSRAKATGKPVLVFFFTDWCTYCHRMKKTTLKNQLVINQIQETIPVWLDAEREGSALKAKFGVKMYPTFVLLSPEGQKFAELEGYASPIMFRDQLKKIIAAYKAKPGLLAKYKAKPADPETNARLAWLYAIQLDSGTAIKHLEIARKAKYHDAPMAAALNMVGDIFQIREQFNSAISYFSEALNQKASTEDRSYSLVSLFSCYSAKGDIKSAGTYGKQLLALPGANKEYVDFVKSMMGRNP